VIKALLLKMNIYSNL